MVGRRDPRAPGAGLGVIWLLLVDGTPAGYFELKADDEGGMEIAYFGLFDEFIGRGLGAHLLTEAVETRLDASRRTASGCTPARSIIRPRIPNYTSRGFTAYKTEEYSV